MKRTNPFIEFIDGMLLADRTHYLTNCEILEAYTGKKFANDDKHKESLKSCKFYSSMNEALRAMSFELRQTHGKDFDLLNGKNRGDGFRYPLDIEDPILNLKSGHKQMRLKQLQKMIDASAGLFPTSWLADLVAGAQSLTNNQKQKISFDQNLHLEHIQWIPTFFQAIEECRTLRFHYNSGYGKDIVEINFEPWYLKEYNQRWFVFGYSTDSKGKPAQYNTIAIDRICGEVEDVGAGNPDDPKRKDFDVSRFDKIVGVTYHHGKKRLLIEIETLDVKTHGRIKTKPLHGKSQKETIPFNANGDNRGRFTIFVIPNDELDTLLMSYGSGIEVVGPEEYRDRFVEKVKALHRIYQ